MPQKTKAVQQNADRCNGLTDGVPKDLLCESHGSIVVDVSQQLLVPVNHFQDPRINEASQAVFSKAAKELNSHHRLHLGHRHVIEQIPYSECHAKFKDEEKETYFFVYGNNQNLYFQDASQWPINCCGCCNCTSEKTMDNIGVGKRLYKAVNTTANPTANNPAANPSSQV